MTVQKSDLREVSINVEGVSLVEFFGVNNEKLNTLKRAFPRLKISSRGSKIKAHGDDADLKYFEDQVHSMIEFLRRYGHMSTTHLETMLQGNEPEQSDDDPNDGDIILHGAHGPIKARTPNQRKLLDMVKENDIIFSVGPAGTGKTFTAVAMAVRALKNKTARKIILTRPAVEAGESLGFLPGDLKDKIDPYLRPLYDALDAMIDRERLKYYMENRVIEIAPLAYMRGRTLNNCFIIMDEAQNATSLQLKMLLTRIGPNAQCIITGDLSQVDLPRKIKSGLSKSIRLLDGIKGIGILRLKVEDVLRHKLVKKIIQAYETEDGGQYGQDPVRSLGRVPDRRDGEKIWDGDKKPGNGNVDTALDNVQDSPQDSTPESGSESDIGRIEPIG